MYWVTKKLPKIYTANHATFTAPDEKTRIRNPGLHRMYAARLVSRQINPRNRIWTGEQRARKYKTEAMGDKDKLTVGAKKSTNKEKIIKETET